jgi:hypothetical protein
LARIADEDIEPDGGDGINPHTDEDIERIRAAEIGNGCEEHNQADQVQKRPKSVS